MRIKEFRAASSRMPELRALIDSDERLRELGAIMSDPQRMQAMQASQDRLMLSESCRFNACRLCLTLSQRYRQYAGRLQRIAPSLRASRTSFEVNFKRKNNNVKGRCDIIFCICV